jgi:Spy/CpxP family protein refolding chaperone
MKRILISTLVLLCMLAFTSVWAQPGPDWDEPPALSPDLKLSKEQQQKIQEMQRNLQKEIIPLRSQLQLKMVDMRSETDKDQPDIAKINLLIDETSKIRAEIAKKRMANHLAVAKVLTPAQLEQWKAERGRMMHEFGHGRQREGMRDGQRQGPRPGRNLPPPPGPDAPQEK